MERGSNKHGPRLDHELKRETRSYEQGAPAGGRVEEHREPEGASDDEELADRMIVKRRSNDDLTPEELELRSEIAKHLKMSIFPASRTTIITQAERDFAPPKILQLLRSLPDGSFVNVEQVWEALGGQSEQRS